MDDVKKWMIFEQMNYEISHRIERVIRCRWNDDLDTFDLRTRVQSRFSYSTNCLIQKSTKIYTKKFDPLTQSEIAF